MKKEVVVAISIGVIIGLVFTYGIYLANQSLKNAGLETNKSTQAESVSPTPPPIQSESSEFSNPVANLLTNQSTIFVEGLVKPNIPVIITTEDLTYYTISSSSGQYSQKVSLEAGYNRIKVTPLSDGKPESSFTRLVTYSTTPSLFIESSPTPSTSPIPTSGTTLRDSVKEQVEKQIAQIKSNITKKAYLGEITSISDASVSLKNYDGTTPSITVTAETTVKLKNNSEGTTKDLKTSDYILAMGDADAQGNLRAIRILVISPPPEDKRQILSGVVKAFTNKTLTVENTVLNISKSTTFLPSKYSFKDIDPGFNVTAVYTPSSSTDLVYVNAEK